MVSIRRNVGPVPISDVERAQWRAGIERFLRAEDPKWTWRGPDIPRLKPAFRSILVGIDGSIWVQPSLPSVPRTPPVRDNPAGSEDSDVRFAEQQLFDVYKADGSYQGQVRLYENMIVYRRSMDSVWGTERDANDVPTVKRWRILWR